MRTKSAIECHSALFLQHHTERLNEVAVLLHTMLWLLPQASANDFMGISNHGSHELGCACGPDRLSPCGPFLRPALDPLQSFLQHPLNGTFRPTKVAGTQAAVQTGHAFFPHNMAGHTQGVGARVGRWRA